MGCFDAVFFKCPKCGGQVEAQTKVGPCDMKAYLPDAVPPLIAASIDGTQERCEGCGAAFIVKAGHPTSVRCWLTPLAIEEIEPDGGFDYYELQEKLRNE